MKKGEIRDTQLANLVASEVEYILGSAGDARLAELIVTAVEPKSNGRHFVVCVAPDEEPAPFASVEELKELLKKASGYIRSELAEALNLKRTPELTIMPDPTYTGPWGRK
jgi:ribosome-binding factor A